MKPPELEFRLSGEQLLEMTNKLIIDLKPQIDDLLFDCVKDVKWIYRI
jgi:hypothetical protein